MKIICGGEEKIFYTILYANSRIKAMQELLDYWEEDCEDYK